jgi:hypothetical protein
LYFTNQCYVLIIMCFLYFHRVSVLSFQNPLPGSVRKESGDSDSVNSAAASNTDSGHGASELEDVLPPRGISYSPGMHIKTTFICETPPGTPATLVNA